MGRKVPYDFVYVFFTILVDNREKDVRQNVNAIKVPRIYFLAEPKLVFFLFF